MLSQLTYKELYSKCTEVQKIMEDNIMKKTIIAVIGVLVSMCLIIGIFAGCNAAKDSKESA